MRTYQYLSGLGSGATVTVPTRELQQVLAARGFSPGAIDGKFGGRTGEALAAAISQTACAGQVHTPIGQRAPYPAQVVIDAALWACIVNLPLASSNSTPSTPRLPSGGGGSGTPSGGGGATTIGPHLDPFPRAGARPAATASTGINWPVVIGAGVLAFGLGWFFLNKKRRGRGRVLRAELVRPRQPKRLTYSGPGRAWS